MREHCRRTVVISLPEQLQTHNEMWRGLREGAMKTEFLSVLLNHIGEAIHIVILNASSLGALIILTRDRFGRKKK